MTVSGEFAAEVVADLGAACFLHHVGVCGMKLASVEGDATERSLAVLGSVLAD